MNVPEGVETETGLKYEFNEMVCENFSNMEKKMGNQVQEGHRTPYRLSIIPFSGQHE